MTPEEKIQTYKSVFQGRSGEDVLKDLEAQCFVNQPSWHPGKPEQSVMFNEGRRSVYLYIKATIEADLDKRRENIEIQDNLKDHWE